MSQDTDSDGQESSQSIIEREVAEAVVRAQKALNQYSNTRQKLALKPSEKVGDPDRHPTLKKKHHMVDLAVLNAFDFLRHYAREEMDNVWNQKVVGYYNEDPVIFGAPPADEIRDNEIVKGDEKFPDDARFLSEFYNQVKKSRSVTHERFKGESVRIEVKPVLLPIDVYRTTVQLLIDVLKETEFAPVPPTPEVKETEPL